MVVTTEEQLPDTESIQRALGKRDCNLCAHAKVCLVVRVMTQALQEPNFTKDTKPFEYNDVAQICKAYLSAAAVKMLQES